MGGALPNSNLNNTILQNSSDLLILLLLKILTLSIMVDTDSMVSSDVLVAIPGNLWCTVSPLIISWLILEWFPDVGFDSNLVFLMSFGSFSSLVISDFFSQYLIFPFDFFCFWLFTLGPVILPSQILAICRAPTSVVLRTVVL